MFEVGQVLFDNRIENCIHSMRIEEKKVVKSHGGDTQTLYRFVGDLTTWYTEKQLIEGFLTEA